MENFCSLAFVPGPFRSPELSFPGNESSWELCERKFLGTFVKVPGNFRSWDLSFSYLHALFYNSSLGVVIVWDAELNC